MTAVETYRTLIRRNYAISQAVRVTGDLDARLALWAERDANSAQAGAIDLLWDVKVAIDTEELHRAFPGLRTGRRTGKANPWAHRTSGRGGR